MEKPLFYMSAGDVAKDRLEQYLEKKLAKITDEGRWELCTFLLDQAYKHEIQHVAFRNPAYQEDQAVADKSWEDYKKNRHITPPQSENLPRGE